MSVNDDVFSSGGLVSADMLEETDDNEVRVFLMKTTRQKSKSSRFDSFAVQQIANSSSKQLTKFEIFRRKRHCGTVLISSLSSSLLLSNDVHVVGSTFVVGGHTQCDRVRMANY